jgi:alkanesulfonate monooxygenase SsuD/methylene tetrahydromethanopterin reductase-like flavin-dependent oxidoreductase (luciferase family)
MRDYVAATRAALAATPQRPTAHEGPFFRTVGFPGHAMTPQRPIPIELAATRPLMTALAAEIADGVMLNSIQPLDWIAGEGAEAVAAGLERGQRPRDAFRVGVMRFVGIDADRDVAYDTARRAVAFYFAIPYFRTLLEPFGFTRELDAGEAALRRGDLEGQVAAVSDELVDAVALAGTPDEVVAKLRRVQEHVDYVVLSSVLGQSGASAREQTLRLVRTFGPVARTPHLPTPISQGAT